MSNNFKNILLAFVLVSLCFMIKCKLDSDKTQVRKDVISQSSNQQSSANTSINRKGENTTSSTAENPISDDAKTRALDIAPGESNEIGIVYNSVNKDGDQKPEIIIESNTYPKHTVLKLFGTVKPKPKKEEKKIDSIEVKQDSTIKD